ncbi:hypothetical protein LZ554_003050 [Drepanopeziza brunnea f. sp. 'monogermtubi']|nr:hypothetical protein LZ554_003050 [Drepanopeziza brunnea f. sp. 'monogermtubi']
MADFFSLVKPLGTTYEMWRRTRYSTTHILDSWPAATMRPWHLSDEAHVAITGMARHVDLQSTLSVG